jgi:undecaprenyl-diphosphatase
VVSFIAAYLALRFLMRYFAQNRPLTPFAVYCLVAGIGCAIYLGVT